MQTEWLYPPEIERLAFLSAEITKLRRERRQLADRARQRKFQSRAKAQ